MRRREEEGKNEAHQCALLAGCSHVGVQSDEGLGSDFRWVVLLEIFFAALGSADRAHRVAVPVEPPPAELAQVEPGADGGVEAAEPRVRRSFGRYLLMRNRMADRLTSGVPQLVRIGASLFRAKRAAFSLSRLCL